MAVRSGSSGRSARARSDLYSLANANRPLSTGSTGSCTRSGPPRASDRSGAVADGDREGTAKRREGPVPLPGEHAPARRASRRLRASRWRSSRRSRRRAGAPPGRSRLRRRAPDLLGNRPVAHRLTHGLTSASEPSPTIPKIAPMNEFRLRHQRRQQAGPLPQARKVSRSPRILMITRFAPLAVPLAVKDTLPRA